MIKIRIDSREKKRGRKALEFYSLKKCDAEIVTLNYGDYVFDEQICFEFKTWEDFLSSMNNKSLFEEVYNQADYYNWSYLIVCGDRDESVRNNFYVNPSMRRRFKTIQNYYGFINQSVDGAIRRCRVVCNVVFVESLDEAWYEMFEQARKCLSGKKYGGTVRKSGVKVNSPMENYLSGIRGFGDKTIGKFMDYFEPKCLQDLLEISYDDLKNAGFNKDKCKNYTLAIVGEYNKNDDIGVD